MRTRNLISRYCLIGTSLDLITTLETWGPAQDRVLFGAFSSPKSVLRSTTEIPKSDPFIRRRVYSLAEFWFLKILPRMVWDSTWEGVTSGTFFSPEKFYDDFERSQS